MKAYPHTYSVSAQGSAMGPVPVVSQSASGRDRFAPWSLESIDSRRAHLVGD